jgi:dTDP-glucose 4,6-dehydratase
MSFAASVVAEPSLTLPVADLELAGGAIGSSWDRIRGSRIFVTGGTGFVGRWLVETVGLANERFGLDAHVTVLTRDPARAVARSGRGEPPKGVQYHTGDIRDFSVPDGRFQWLVHAAADPMMSGSDDQMSAVVDGAQRVLAFAKAQPLEGFLLVSSGAVYGRQPPDVALIPEDHVIEPPSRDDSPYASAKRAAESACLAAADHLPIRVARCFAFVGPLLPLDGRFAIGNFIDDRIHDRPIRVSGDGTPVRSYMYAADLAVWLWTILLRGESGRAYNVGSETAVSIEDTAKIVARAAEPEVAVTRCIEPVAGQLASRYVPSTARARRELGLRQTVDLTEAVRRTIRWHRNAP